MLSNSNAYKQLVILVKGGLTHFPPKFGKKIVPVITFFPFLLYKYLLYHLVVYCVCFKMICKKSL